MKNVKVTYVCCDVDTEISRNVLLKDYNPKDIFRVTNYKGKFLKDYRNQKVLVLDAFYGDIPINDLNDLLDMYPVDCGFRYGLAQYEEVYIFSPVSFGLVYSDEPRVKQQALARRIHNYVESFGYTCVSFARPYFI